MVGLATRGRVLPNDLLATLVDLAERGHLVIQVTGEGRKGDWLLRKGPARQQGLSPAEQSFLTRIFRSEGKVSLRELAAEPRGALTRLATRLRDATVKNGWFVPQNRLRRINWWGLLGAGTAAVVVLVVGFGWLPAGLFLVAGLITMYQPQLRVRRTARGSAVRAQVLAHRERLTTGAPLNTVEELRRELPWLVAFGLTTRPPRLADAAGLGKVGLQFDWIEGPGGALDLGGVAVGVGAEVLTHVAGKALIGAVASAAALLD